MLVELILKITQAKKIFQKKVIFIKHLPITFVEIQETKKNHQMLGKQFKTSSLFNMNSKLRWKVFPKF